MVASETASSPGLESVITRHDSTVEVRRTGALDLLDEQQLEGRVGRLEGVAPRLQRP